jgi:NADH-quinone oxidoreductase subunit L
VFDLPDAHGHEAAGHGDAHAISHGHDEHAHAKHGPNDGSPLMWVPLVILCVGAIGAGYLGVFGASAGQHEGGWFHGFVGQVTAGEMAYEEAAGEAHGISAAAMMTISGIIAIIGVLIAYYFYVVNRAAAAAMGVRFSPLVKFLYNKWYIDEIYAVLFLKPLWLLAHLLSYFDRYVIDGLVFIVGFIPQLVGYSLKPTQRGLLPRYAVGMIAGLAAVVLGVLYLIR